MSRLQAPGFSKLKAPGFSRSVPVPSQKASSTAADPVFKRPQDVQSMQPTSTATVQPVATSNIAQPRSQLTRMKIPSKATTPNQPLPSSQHGPSPYDRGKPAGGHIPYVGKRRVTGSLKAPESKLARPSMPPKAREPAVVPRQPNASVRPSIPTQANPKLVQVKSASVELPSTEHAMPRPSSLPSTSEPSKPVKRQLIPGTKAQSKLSRPKSYNDPSVNQVKQSGLAKPRASGRGTSAQPSNQNLKSSNRRLSQSLHSIPPANSKPVKKNSIGNKSLSQENLSEKVKRNSLTKPPLQKTSQVKAPSQLKGPLNKLKAPAFRPRVSTQNNTLNATVNISTPCQMVKTDKQHLKAIKISPISNEHKDINTTFDVSHSIVPQTLEESGIFDNSEVNLNTTYAQPSIQPSLNATYNTDITSNNKLNQTYSETEVVLNRIETNNNAEELNTLNQTTVLDSVQSSNEINNQTFNLNETRVLSTTATTALDKTKSLNDDVNNKEIFEFDADDSDNFIDNIEMPEHFCMDTPKKSTDESQYPEFSDDIAAIIAAISYNGETQTSQTAVTTSRSPLKNLQQELFVSPVKPSVIGVNKTDVAEYDVVDELAPSSSTTSYSASFVDGVVDELGVDVIADNDASKKISQESPSAVTTELESSTASNNGLNFCEDYYSSEPPQHDTTDKTIENDTLTKTMENEQENHSVTKPIEIPKPLEPDDVDAAHSQPAHVSPATPSKLDDEFSFNINERCNTISMGAVKRRKNHRFGNRIGRSNTFGSQDLLSKFRTPKEANLIETLDGNILMDNTTFLHFGNETRAMKTQLLKLRRTLLEIDCPSPLMKPPLKRSNSAKVSTFTDAPPLSPRTSVSSPMAVVDPLVHNNESSQHVVQQYDHTQQILQQHEQQQKEKDETTSREPEDISTITEKYQESLIRLEEMEKEIDAKEYTIKLLQTQLEQKDEAEQDMEEQNIMLQHEVAALTERFQRLIAHTGVDEGELFSSGSFKDEFDLADSSMSSRTDILKRMYSRDSND